jgi:PIN domain nuclease of toxin-antitoxin system
MKILLDTHVWIWSQELPEKLGSKARNAIADERILAYPHLLSLDAQS